jgi:putative ABC transport system substrate-binding protein
MALKRIALLVTVGVSAIAAVAGIAQSRPTATAGKKVCMDQYVTAPVIADVVHGMRDGLKGSGVDFILKNSEADAANLQTIAKQFQGMGCDVYTPIATPTAQVDVKLVKDKPIVFLGSSTPVAAGLVKSLTHPGGNVTGVSDPFPVRAEIDAMLRIDPKIKRIGLIWKNGDPAGDVLAKTAKDWLKQRGIAWKAATITNASEASQAAQSLAGQVDAIELPGDATTISAVPAIIKFAKQAKLPVFGATADTVKGGGIVAGTYDYYKVGRAGASMVLRILNGTKAGSIPVLIPGGNAVTLTVNRAAAKGLGLTIPKSVHATNVK